MRRARASKRWRGGRRRSSLRWSVVGRAGRAGVGVSQPALQLRPPVPLFGELTSQPLQLSHRRRCPALRLSMSTPATSASWLSPPNPVGPTEQQLPASSRGRGAHEQCDFEVISRVRVSTSVGRARASGTFGLLELRLGRHHLPVQTGPARRASVAQSSERPCRESLRSRSELLQAESERSAPTGTARRG